MTVTVALLVAAVCAVVVFCHTVPPKGPHSRGEVPYARWAAFWTTLGNELVIYFDEKGRYPDAIDHLYRRARRDGVPRSEVVYMGDLIETGPNGGPGRADDRALIVFFERTAVGGRRYAALEGGGVLLRDVEFRAYVAYLRQAIDQGIVRRARPGYAARLAEAMPRP